MKPQTKDDIKRKLKEKEERRKIYEVKQSQTRKFSDVPFNQPKNPSTLKQAAGRLRPTYRVYREDFRLGKIKENLRTSKILKKLVTMLNSGNLFPMSGWNKGRSTTQP